jgi:hypothetical protein
VAAFVCPPTLTHLTSQVTIYGWSTSEASPQTAEVPTIVTGSRSGQSAIRAN